MGPSSFLVVLQHLDGGSSLAQGQGRVLGGRDHEDTVGGQVGVDGLGFASLRHDVPAEEVLGGEAGAVLGLLLVLALHRQNVVVLNVDLQLVRPELVSVQRHLELGLVLLHSHQLVGAVDGLGQVPVEPEVGSRPASGGHEPGPLSHGAVGLHLLLSFPFLVRLLLAVRFLLVGLVLLLGVGLDGAAAAIALLALLVIEELVSEPVPHPAVFMEHVATQEVEVVAPGGLEERVGPEHVAKSDGNEGHLEVGVTVGDEDQ